MNDKKKGLRMKMKLMWGALIAIAFASCTQEDVLNNPNPAAATLTEFTAPEVSKSSAQAKMPEPSLPNAEFSSTKKKKFHLIVFSSFKIKSSHILNINNS